MVYFSNLNMHLWSTYGESYRIYEDGFQLKIRDIFAITKNRKSKFRRKIKFWPKIKILAKNLNFG